PNRRPPRPGGRTSPRDGGRTAGNAGRSARGARPVREGHRCRRNARWISRHS
ncbi:hypothetical protein TMLG_00798, partial [Mycobacterium tuberculosis SUMu012]